MNSKLLLLLALLGSSLVFADSSSSSSADSEENSITANVNTDALELQSQSNSDANENEFQFSASLEDSGRRLVFKVESKNSNGDSENESKLEARIGDYVVYVDTNADGKFSDGDTAVTTYNQWVWSDFTTACTTATNGDVSCLITGTDSTTSADSVTLSLDLQVKGSTWTQGSFTVPPNAVQFTVSSSSSAVLAADQAIALCIQLDTEDESGLSDDDSEPSQNSVNTGAAGFAAENTDDNGAVENSDVTVAVRRRDSGSSSSSSNSGSGELSKLKCYSFSGNSISNWDPVMTSPASALVFSLLALVF